MKALIASILLATSLSSFASVSATDAFNSVLTNGTYTGTACTVKVSGDSTYTHVVVEEGSKADFFTVMNIPSNMNYAFSYDANKNEFYATQKLNFPRYYYGGSKSFFAKNDNSGKAYVAISNVLLDHRGNDMSTDVACEVTLK